MSYKIEIPITGNSDCTEYYEVWYKKDTEVDFQQTPNQIGNSVIVKDLDCNTNYDFRIRKKCCDGRFSPTKTTQITTGSC